MKIDTQFNRTKAKRGTFKNEATRTASGFWHSQSYKTDVEVLLRPTRIRVSSAKGITCRDQFTASVHNALRNAHQKWPTLTITGNDASLPFTMNTGSNGVDYMANIARIAVLGHTNAEMNPASSPFVLRFMEGVSRMAILRHGVTNTRRTKYEVEEAQAILKRLEDGTNTLEAFFYQLMLRADAEGIRLNENVLEAWAVDQASSYAMLGLSTLKMAKKQAALKAEVNWETIFPPTVLL